MPVLIVGAGPAGLTSAIALARAGVDCLLVERRAGQSSLPRATSISLRSMELLRGWGLEPEVRAGGPEVEWQMWICETLASAASGYAIPAGLPSREQSALLSPTAPTCVPQDHLEAVLLSHLRSLAPARAEFDTELVGLERVADGFEATLRHAGAAPRTVRASYVIGADGAHGRTRDRLGIGMWSSGRLLDAVTALFRAPLWELLGAIRYGLYSLQHPEAPGSFLPAGTPDRWMYGLLIRDGGPAVEDVDEALLRRQIRIGSGLADFEPRIERMGRFTFAAGLADEFRRGNGFLVGDAAHRVTPRGGTGMNMAVQGAFDLGWKLAWVLRGWAGPGLLDTYESERRPVAMHNIERSTDPAGSEREPGEEVQVDLAGRLPHLWSSRGRARVSTLDLLTSGLTLFTGPETGWEQAAATLRGTPPVSVRRLDPIVARGLGVQQGGCLVVRPDGVPAAWLPANCDRGSALEVAIAAALDGSAPSGGLRRAPAPPPPGARPG